jgi:pyruvate carboxylase
MGLGERWPEVSRAYADVNLAFGDIVKVTPSSKVVGDMALFLVSHGISIRELERLGADHNLNIPNSVVEMFSGALGEPLGGWPRRIARVVLRGGKPKKGRPGAHLPKADLGQVAADLEKKIHRKPSRTDLMSFLMYPDVFGRFVRDQAGWGDVEVLPTPQFFFGMEKGEEIAVELEPGKTLIIKFLAIGEPHPDGTRTVFFELNGQPREVTIRDKSLQGKVEERAKADPANPGHIGAPIPGAVTSVAVELNQSVKKGDRLLVMEAMKMQTTVTAPVAGKVTRIPVQPGQSVEPKDLLVVIE